MKKQWESTTGLSIRSWMRKAFINTTNRVLRTIEINKKWFLQFMEKLNTFLVNLKIYENTACKKQQQQQQQKKPHEAKPKPEGINL